MTVVSEARAGRESGGQTQVLEAQGLEIVRVQIMPGSLWLAVRDVPCIVQMCLSYRHQGARPSVELTVWRNSKISTILGPTSLEWALLSQKTRVQFPAPTLEGSQPPATSVPMDLTFSSGIQGHLHTCEILYMYRQNFKKRAGHQENGYTDTFIKWNTKKISMNCCSMQGTAQGLSNSKKRPGSWQYNFI